MIVLRNVAQVKLPDDLKKVILGMYLHYKTKFEKIRNYRYKGGMAYLPPNMTKLKMVAALTGQQIVDERSLGRPLSEPFKLNQEFVFRPHQIEPAQKLLDFILAENYGILKAGCGCGKTVTMTYVSGHLGCRILILVDMGSLLSQWQEAFAMVWNKEVQILDSKTAELGDICIATFQMLHANPELMKRLRDEFGCLLLDEFHSTASDTRREVLLRLNNKYRIGCTATLMKKGYSDDVLTDLVSDKFIEMKDEKALKPLVYFKETGVRFYSNDPNDWGKIQSDLGKSLLRNKLIADDAIEHTRAGRKVLVVGVTVGSLKQMLIHLKKHEHVKAKLYVGSTTLAQDKELRRQLEAGEVNCVLTVRKMDKGADFPSLDILLLARPANNWAFVQQVSGRIVRAVKGKPDPIVVDYVDVGDLAVLFADNRSKWYQELKYIIAGVL